jgi:hypothetical protein
MISLFELIVEFLLPARPGQIGIFEKQCRYTIFFVDAAVSFGGLIRNGGIFNHRIIISRQYKIRPFDSALAILPDQNRISIEERDTVFVEHTAYCCLACGFVIRL